MKHYRSIPGVVLVIFVLLLSVIRPSAAQDRPNILWITTEDMSPWLGSYGADEAVTPNLDRLAEGGIRFTRAYAASPICAPVRSGLITGVHSTSLGTMHLRMNMQLPGEIRTLPEMLREQGYFTTNNAKTDYNFSPEGRWDENGADAHWRHRPEGTPFFSVFNFMTTHEGPTNRDDERDLEGLTLRHDPGRVEPPPFLPDTPEMRRILAHHFDLVSQMDRQAGEVLQQLEEDGLADRTIVFFFSDHGDGLPRQKRWLYTSGLHIPFILHVPEQYRHLVTGLPGTVNDELVTTIDMVPTVLSLTGTPLPDHLHGRPFAGEDRRDEPEYLVFARDRADDVFDLARAVITDRYLYVRHFMPHQPYAPEADIFSDRKSSYRELRRAFDAGELDSVQAALYHPRPVEELYDLENDPHQLNNLAAYPENSNEMRLMRERLRQWMLDAHDTALLPEPELIARSEGTTAYEMARTAAYDLPRILEAAERVGNPDVPVREIEAGLTIGDAAVRYWSLVALMARDQPSGTELDLIQPLLEDPSAAVAIQAAAVLCHAGTCETAIPVLRRHLLNEARPWDALFAAAAIRDLGEKARPLEADVRKALDMHSGTAGGRFKDWLYSMFIGFAMDQTLVNLGLEVPAP